MAIITVTGTPAGDVLSSRNVSGSAGVIFGFAGNDTILGGSGGDSLFGNLDNDSIVGNGADFLAGGQGQDTLVGTSTDSLFGNKDADILIGGGTEAGGQGNDTIYGGGVANGELGNDLIYGATTMNGGDGNDTLVGSSASNTFTGNASSEDEFNADQFVFAPATTLTVAGNTVIQGGYGGVDTITDFQSGPGLGDVIKLVNLDSAATVAVSQTGADVTITITGTTSPDQGSPVAGSTSGSVTTGSNQSAAQTIVVRNVNVQQFLAVGSEDLIVNDNIVLNTSNAIAISVNGTTAYTYTVNPRVGRNIDAIGVNGVRLTANDSNFQLNGVPQFPSVNNDTIFGSDVTDRIDGLDGDDQIAGRSGNDTIFGGNGNDTIFGNNSSPTGGIEVFITSEGNVTIPGSTDILFGEAGNDVIYGDNTNSPVPNSGEGPDFIDGGVGNDSLLGEGGSDTVFGGEGNDTILGGSQADLLVGGIGNDVIFGDPAGVTGNDVILGGAGDDIVDAGSGNDYIEGGAGNDVIAAGDGSDLVSGDAGNDSILGGSGTVNVLVGGGGADTIQAEAGSIFNVLIGKTARVDDDSAIDLLAGFAGFTAGSILGDYTGKGATYSYSSGSTLPTASVGNFLASIVPDGIGDTIITAGLASLVTGDGSIINGSAVVTSNQGSVVGISAAVYSPANFGGFTNLSPLPAGDAALAAFPQGVEGDVLFVPNSLGSAVVNLGANGIFGVAGTATYSSIGGVDTLIGIEHAVGGSGNDILQGNALGNLLAGGDGDDTLLGFAGNDYLSGGNGSDSFNGGDGDDTIDGGLGNDSILGGAGNDLITPGSGSDTVVGGAGNDTINLATDSARDVIAFTTTTQTNRTSEGIDLVTGFEIGDQVQIGGVFFQELNDVYPDSILNIGIVNGLGAKTFDVTSVVGIPGFTGGDEVAFLATPLVGSVSSASAVAALINATGGVIETALGQDALLFVNNGVDTGIYYFATNTVNGLADATELNLLATVNGVIGAASGGSFNNLAFV